MFKKLDYNALIDEDHTCNRVKKDLLPRHEKQSMRR